MKKIICVIFFTHLCNLCFPQISLDSSNFPVAGTAYNRFICVGGFIGNSGASQFYDFSNTLIWMNDTMRYIPPAATTFGAYHPGASVATVQWGDITLIWYYSADNNAFWTSGGTILGDFGQGMTAVHANHPAPYVDTLLSNDYSFGNTETEISGIRFQNLTPGVDYQTISGKYIVCDGYGMLYAPLDTFTNVLRVKYIEFKYDTVFANGAPVDTKTDTLYYYKYFAQGIRHPVVIANVNQFDEIKWIEALVIPDTMFGCTDAGAENYNPLATANDGTCIYCNQANYTITPDKNICKNESVNLSATGATNFLWSTGDTVSSITVNPDSSQTYSVYLNNQSYCWEIATVDISVYEEALAEFWATTVDGDSILFVNTSLHATNYFWNFGDSTTSTEKNPRHLYNYEGTKTVMLIAYNQCSSDTFYFDITISGAEEFQSNNSQFIIYPNPTSGKCTIQTTGIRNQSFSIKVNNIIGEIIIDSRFSILSADNSQIDLSGKPSGIYFVQIMNGENIYRQKIIKM